MKRFLPNLLALGLVAGLVGLAVYFLAFGQTFDGEIEITAQPDHEERIGLVTFQSRFTKRRFLTHSVYLDLAEDTPITYQGQEMDAREAVDRFTGRKMPARVGYREQKSGWGYVVSLDLEPTGSSPKELVLIGSLLLIFGCTGGMAVIANTD